MCQQGQQLCLHPLRWAEIANAKRQPRDVMEHNNCQFSYVRAPFVVQEAFVVRHRSVCCPCMHHQRPHIAHQGSLDLEF